MDYELSDSSGTDDDLPPPHRNRIPSGLRPTGNGRTPAFNHTQLPRMYSDMETQIHNIEQEAYSSVLRAFKAQSDAITWEKEGLITELRKELRVSDEEHRELLARVNSDDIIHRIREWRKSVGLQPGMPSTGQPVHDRMPSPSISASRKKQKTSQPIASMTMDTPSPVMHTGIQPPPFMRQALPGSRGKKPKMYSSLGMAGRSHVPGRGSAPSFAANEVAEGNGCDPLIGKKIWTRWPEDNHFYEAVITNYDPVEGRHALVYDMNTANETWEYVNLKEISPEDIRWESEDPGIFRRGGRPGHGRGSKKSAPRGGAVHVAGRGRGGPKNQPKKDFTMQNGIGKKSLTDLEILHTESLIKEVEKVYGSNNPDPVEMDNMKKTLKEHEQALVDAITMLEGASDGESDGNQPPIGRPMEQIES